MIDREEQFKGQAAEHARLYAVFEDEVNRIANEIIDHILAENPEDVRRASRRDEAYERELAAIAGRIEARGEIEIGTLPALRYALMRQQIRTPVALTLAYRLGSHGVQCATQSTADGNGVSP